MIAAVFTTAVVTAVTVFAACAVASQWRAARAVIRQTQNEGNTPIPYQLAVSADDPALLAELCWTCHDTAGAITCICGGQCGHLACMGGFSDEDIQFLRGLTMPEGTEQ